MTLALERPGILKPIGLFEEPTHELFIVKEGGEEVPGDPARRYNKEAFDAFHKRWAEKARGVQLVFRRVLDTVYGPWPWKMQALEAEERQALIALREENKNDPEHLCHRSHFHTKDYDRKNNDLEREILGACLIGAIGLDGFQPGQTKTEEERLELIDTLMINGLGSRATWKAMIAQGLTVNQSLF